MRLTLGPVFKVELVTTARRPRYFAIRVLYCLLILLVFWSIYESWASVTNGTSTILIQDATQFATRLFVGFAILQYLMILLLTPALVGGTIADERQRKTLHYLLASQLSSFEIIFGKLGARLLHVLVLVLAGLPIVAILGLMGGVDYLNLFTTYVGTLSTLYFLGCLSILISVVSKRARDSVVVAYLIIFVWLVVPTVLINFFRFTSSNLREIAWLVTPVLEWFAAISPLELFSTPVVRGFSTRSFLAQVSWFVGLQILYGSLFLILASSLLRRVAARDGEAPQKLSWYRKLHQKRSWTPRRRCGNDPMLWKEIWVSRSSRLVKGISAFVWISLVGLMFYVLFEPVDLAWVELKRDGYFGGGYHRTTLAGYIQAFNVLLYILMGLTVAISAATSITSEREEDQWISLTSTPLMGHEILKAKFLGSVFRVWPLFILMLGLWGIGCSVGSFSLLSIAVSLLCIFVYIWFLAILGLNFSLSMKNSTRSMALTIFVILFSNLGYMFCLLPLRFNDRILGLGITPMVVGLSQWGYDRSWRSSSNAQEVQVIIGSLIIYAGFAVYLTIWAYARFETSVGRPNRFHRSTR